MFTGIIEDIGEVVDIKREGNGLQLAVRTSLDDIERGDSISVNGVCLTVKNVKECTIYFDVSRETFKVSTLNLLKIGEKVNIERAMRANGRFHGHIVMGHVDCTGIIKAFYPEDGNRVLKVWIPSKFKNLVVYKGSIAIDGISLTVNRVENTLLTINIIPYTYENTILKYKRANDRVNIEFDIIGKYIMKLKGYNL